MLPLPGKRVERRGPGRDESGSRSIPSGLLLGLLNIRIQSLPNILKLLLRGLSVRALTFSDSPWGFES